MPAKKKYLSRPWKRVSKITAAILGGYVATMLSHIACIKLAANDTPVLMTSAYTTFFVWVGLMVLAFFIHKAWHVWGLYLLIAVLSAAGIFVSS
jgi:hypothetical protein